MAGRLNVRETQTRDSHLKFPSRFKLLKNEMEEIYRSMMPSDRVVNYSCLLNDMLHTRLRQCKRFGTTLLLTNKDLTQSQTPYHARLHSSYKTRYGWRKYYVFLLSSPLRKSKLLLSLCNSQTFPVGLSSQPNSSARRRPQSVVIPFILTLAPPSCSNVTIWSV